MRQVSEKHQVVVATGKELRDTGVAADDDRSPIRLTVDVLDKTFLARSGEPSAIA